MTEPTAPTPPRPAKKRRTWRQRFRILVLVLLIGGVLFRVALNLLLPTAIDRVANLYDLEAGYDRLSLSLLGGNAQLYGLKLRPKGGGDSILQADYLQGDLSPLDLFRGRLVVYRAEVDGMIVAVTREADGTVPLLDRFASARTKTATVAATRPASPVRLDAPLRVDAVRLSHVTTRLTDKSVTPEFSAVLRTDLRVSDVGVNGSPTKFELNLSVDPLVEAVRVVGQATTAPDSVTADMKLSMRGLHPRAASGYLAVLGLRAAADEMTAEANLSVSAATIPNSGDFKAAVKLSDVKAVSDGLTWAALRTFELKADRLGATAAEIDSVTVAGGLGAAARNARGDLELAGLTLGPAPAAAPPATRPATSVAPPAGPPFRFTLRSLSVTDCQAAVSDRFVSPAAEWAVRLDALKLDDFDTASAKPVPFSLKAAVPGVLRGVDLDGRLSALASTKTLDVSVDAQGVRPDALKPYLTRLGLRSDLDDAHFTADVSASVAAGPAGVTASAAARGVKFVDGGTSLVEMNTAALDTLTYAAPATPDAAARFDVKRIDLSGPALRVVRDADGRPSAAGFTFVGPPAAPPAAPPDAAPAAPPAAPTTRPSAPPAALPVVRIGSLSWKDVRLTLEDRAASPPDVFEVNNAGIELNDFLFDLAATERGAVTTPGKFVAFVGAPGLADQAVASGSFLPGPGRLTVTADVDADGLSGMRVAPYLKAFGVVPTLRRGHFAAKASGTLTRQADGLRLDAETHDVSLADDGVELAGVDFAGANGLLVTPRRIDADSVSVVRPRLLATREADGTLAAVGVRLVPVAATPTTPATQPASGPAPAPLKLPAYPIDLGVKSLYVDGADVRFIDTPESADVRLQAGVRLLGLDTAAGSGPAKLSVTLASPGVLRDGKIDGSVRVAAGAPAAKLHVVLDGLRTGPVAAYLPPGLGLSSDDGRLDLTFAADAADHPDGGLAATLRAGPVAFGDAAAPAIEVGDATVRVRRFDPAADVFEFDEISAHGVAGTVRQSASALDAFGLRLTPAAGPTTRPVEAAVAAATQPVGSLASMVADGRRPLPRVAIDTLDVGVIRLTVGGFTGANAADVVLHDFSLTAPDGIKVGRSRDNEAAIKLAVGGGVTPLVDRFDVGLSVTPLANEPALTADISAHGIKGDGLTRLLPALAARLDGGKLQDGTFTTRIQANLSYGRRGPRDFDLARGFTASLDVRPVEFRATPGGPVQAGVKAIHAEGIRVEPKRGNAAVASLEIDTPILRAVRDDRGLNLGNMTFLLGRDETAETLTTPAAPTTAAAEPAAPPPPAERPAGEMRLDRLTVSGVDVVVEDRTATPATVVPLKSLDVDVQGLSNQLPWNGKPVRFSLLTTSDKVALPPRRGIRGQATTGRADGEDYTEQRELFSQVTASGRVGFKRQGDAVVLDGWAKTAVNGFELLGVRGLAKTYGVTVGGGVLDDTNDVRFNPNGRIETKNKVVFTNLALSEPENGPIQRLFKLKTPLDLTIATVTDADGSITLDLPVAVKNGTVNAGDVVGPAVLAVTNVLVTATLSAPVKAISGVGSLFGLGGKEAAPEPPVTVHFLPAYAGLSQDARTALAPLREALRNDPTLEVRVEQTLTDADVARSAVRASPPPETAIALAEQLRRQKADLLQRYAALSARARGAYGAQANDQAAADAAALRDTARQLARADASLDELYALTTPGAAGQTPRRTRAAALDVARARLEGVKAALLDGLPADVATRVSLLNAQFAPEPSPGGGTVTVTLVRKKH